MESQRSGSEDSFEHFDADAVCEQCSTVNPAGTLLCKTCGNNLRDQRMRRLTADEGMDAAHASDRPIRVLTGLLVVFGLLAILWAAINVWNGNVENWLTNRIEVTETKTSIDPAQFWTGDDASVYDTMSRELRDNPISEAEAALSPEASETLDGRYTIRENAPGSRLVGGALVQTRGNTVYFVAQIGRLVEIRGKVPVNGDGQYEAEQIGVEWGNSVLDAYGVARRQPTGNFTCVGVISDTGDRAYAATVSRVPQE